VRLYFSSASALRSNALVFLAFITPITFTGCGSSAFSNPQASRAPTASMLMQTPSVPPVLLLNGAGTISSDVAAVEAILKSLNLNYATANSSEMDSMTETKLRSYRLLIVPGGNSITIGNNLTRSATSTIHNAVQNGLHYLGICAGGFFGGYSIYNGLNLTNGVWFNVYHNGGKGTRKTAVEIKSPFHTRDEFWEDGPQFTGWGTIAAKYPDGTPAVVEGKSGNGWVILSGFHSEAPASWRYGMNFSTSVAIDNEYAAMLVNAALSGSSIPHF